MGVCPELPRSPLSCSCKPARQGTKARGAEVALPASTDQRRVWTPRSEDGQPRARGWLSNQAADPSRLVLRASVRARVCVCPRGGEDAAV